MSTEIGWKFPSTDGGETDGYNHSGIGHFRGTPFQSLARETIQNSLDAALVPERPVNVVFELIDLDSNDFGGSELAEIISACLSAVQDPDDDPAHPALKDAKEIISAGKVPSLRISDRNTIGLSGRHWQTLVKTQGHSYKPDVVGAGGSHGIGKNAPFAVSDLRTVFYWSCFEDDNKQVCEKFQGKSILTSHESDNEEKRGTGFYGIKQHCQEMVDDIPDRFRITDNKGTPVQGTSLTIVGFRANIEEWRRRIAESVLASFFYAIDNDRLRITLEPVESEEFDEINGEIDINRETLDKWFGTCLSERNKDKGASSEELEENAVKNAQIYRQIAKGKCVETQDTDLGHCRLWIDVGDDDELPNSVALVRRSGMLVTDRQRGLLQFRGFRNFAALMVFEDPEGNNLLRCMENERHDQFEPDRLPVADRQRGHKALKRITKWIRDQIRQVAGPSEEGRQTTLDELASFLPLYEDSEDVFDFAAQTGDTGERERGLGERITVKLKPVRQSNASWLPTETPEGDEDGDGLDTGEIGGGGTGSTGGADGSGGPSEGGGTGGSGDRGGGATQRSIPVSCVRLLPIQDRKNCYRLSFVADFEGDVSLTLEEAGDSSTIPRNDFKVMDSNSSLKRVPVSRGARNIIEITADQPVTDRAWRLSAVAAWEGQQ